MIAALKHTFKKLSLILLVLLFFNACASYKPQYLDEDDRQNIFPDKEVDQVFYLVGDAGLSPMNGMSDGLTAFQHYISDKETEGDYTLFLGDNIYPAGLPPATHSYRAAAENMINAQVKAVESFKGQSIFVPGNHEWYSGGGVEGVRRQEEYVKKLLGENSFLPEKGCPLKTIEVSETIHMIIVDTQWYLENWDHHPTINDDCVIKTRERLLLELEMEIENAQGKTIVFAMHHPLYTNSTHGGQFALEKHLYPIQSKIPMPGLASLVAQIRSQGGVSIQDRYNELYNDLMIRLENLATENGNIVFVSGHEHTLQYIDNGNIKQIVSGAGSKTSPVNLKRHGVFAYGDQGFAVLTVFKDGSSWVQYFAAKENKPDLLFQKEVYPAQEPYDISALPESFPNDVEVAIYSEGNDDSALFTMLLDEDFRDIYKKPIKVPVATLDTLYGGLEVVRAGGGHQAKSLRLQTKDGRALNMRALRKSGTQYLEKVLSKSSYVSDDYEQTEIESLILDFYTSAHPYAFMAIPDLSDAAKIYHTTPRIFYIPKHRYLGNFNKEFGDQLYVIEERAEESYTEERNFGFADDIESTYDIIEKVREDEHYKIDENAYVRARLFDMLIGDWDRHPNQWRWARFNQENGDRVYKPIPRNRDQVFSNFDGALLDVVKIISGSKRRLQVYDETLEDIEWMNSAGVKLDRVLLQQSDREVWLKQAQFLEKNVTDEVIENAFENIPLEVQDSSIEDIKRKLKGRRQNLVDIATRYYRYLNELVVVTGTNEDDHFEISRLDDGLTQVTVSRRNNDVVGKPFINRTYDSRETKELWVYGLNGDDHFEVNGKGKSRIFTRIVGGQGHDVYDIKSGKGIKVYDHRSKENTVLNKNGANIKFTDVYNLNVYNFEKTRTKTFEVTPGLNVNPDVGLLLGASAVYTVNGFQRNPFSQQHTLDVQFAFDTNGFRLDYKGEFANFFLDWNLEIGGTYTTPNYTTNFFGYSNESDNDTDTYDFNRIKQSVYRGQIGVVKRSAFGSDYGFRTVFEGIQIGDTADRFITEYQPATNERFYKRHYFGALEAEYDYFAADNKVNPSKGMVFNLNIGARTDLQDINKGYGYINSNVGFYNALTKNKALVLKTDVRAQFRFGHDFYFYQAASIGGESGLRGYRTDRFTGKHSLVTSADVRYSFPSINTRLWPLQFTVFGGGDLGRVWVKGDYSNKWHNDYGGGFRVTAAKSLSGTVNLFTGEDGSRFSFGLGYNF